MMKLWMLELSVFHTFRGFVCKRYSDTFFIYFSRKGKVNHMTSLLCFTYDGSSFFIRC